MAILAGPVGFHSYYLPAQRHQETIERRANSYVGIGVTVDSVSREEGQQVVQNLFQLRHIAPRVAPQVDQQALRPLLQQGVHLRRGPGAAGFGRGIKEKRRPPLQTGASVLVLWEGVLTLGANLLKLKPCIVLADGKMTVGKKYRGAFAPFWFCGRGCSLPEEDNAQGVGPAVAGDGGAGHGGDQ